MSNKCLSNDIKGQRFGRLIAVEKSPNHKSGTRLFWECLCDCGKTHLVRADHLRDGRIQSCGCLNHENLLKRNTKHNQSKTPQYKIWFSLVARCTNPNNNSWKNYGARGITVCPEWLEFENFLRDMPGWEPGKSIERVDVNKGYSKENCTWIDKYLQRLNTRRSIRITIQGETKVLSEWCKLFKLDYLPTYRKLKKGLPLEQVLNQPAWAAQTPTTRYKEAIS